MKFKLKPAAIGTGMSKLFLVMKLVIAFFILFSTQVSAKLLAQEVTLKAKNLSLEKLLMEVEKQTGYHFIYDSDLKLLKSIKIDVNVQKVKVKDLLDKSLGNLPMQYTIIQQTIAIKGVRLPESDATKKEVVISGKITDESGQPIPGASVMLKGSTKGVVSDSEGRYSISTPDGKGILIFAFVGYSKAELEISGRTTINVTMKIESFGLDEVVAIGYGTKKKRELTGATATVNAQAISEQTITGFDQALAGRVSGVQIVQNSSTPGGGTSVRMRGVSTPGVNEPLYVIDGVPVFSNDVGNGGGALNVLNFINPNDIESIDILKDAASAAIYGSRAANGVVIVTTKKGKEGKPKLSMDYYYGAQTFEKRFDMLNAEEYKSFLTARKTPFTNSNFNTNWLEEITQTAPMQNANISVSGGNQSSNYYSSVGYLNQEGIVKNSNYERFTARFNSNSTISEKIKIGTNFSVARDKQLRRGENDFFSSSVGLALYFPPTVPVRESAGQYGDALEYVPSFVASRPNPVANVEVGSGFRKNMKLLGNIFGEYQPIKNLVYKLNLGADYQSSSSDSYFPGYIFGVANRVVGTPGVNRGTNNSLIWLVEHTLNYKLTLANDHNFNVLAGATQQAARLETLYGAKSNAVSKDPNLTTIDSSPATLQSASGNVSEWSIASFLGRFDYNYKGKYLFSATVRRDGSSRFAPGNQWGTFPSLSAGWIVSDESFFKSNVISNLKLRGSWGRLGNQEISAFQYLSTLGNTQYILNGVSVAGVFPNSVSNPNITWETSEQKDIGVDISLLKNRITFTADYFDKTTKGILLSNPISTVYGYTNSGGGSITPTSNSGIISNKGLEFAVNVRNSEHALKWSFDINAATLKNKVVSLGGGDPIINSMNSGLFSTKTDVGSQIGAFYGKINTGLGPDGHLQFAKDANGADIQTIIGNPIPNLTYGANVNLSYKNFDFSMALQGVNGNDIFATTLFQIGNFSYGANNQIKSIYDQAGVTAPAVATANGADYAASTWYVYDGSFLRLRSVQIGYNLPFNLMKKIGISRCRVYVSGQNLFTFDNYKIGLNPEVGAFNQNNTSAGVDQGTYPAARVITTGVSLTF
ncbi:TonB-dependent receptor [Pedobacter sp. MC2016-05]|uniref:SusC/RagA family TonB-linked outer membrane protein n=1 Tax=Pedobacter sp. MC2016-05 TaxID=2994474 RepID=UPI00224756B8|nr:TonB-dependent receptor [Pedobacter sp. MC2016-05]MCX2475318.1 TonB-dependent receptor [Pedobacter sp. MC2016-05]